MAASAAPASSGGGPASGGPASGGGGGGAQTPASHGWPLHEVAHVPQCAGSTRRSASQPVAGSPSQSAKPAWHVKPQRTPSHVAVELGVPPHGVHDAPHVAGSSLGTHDAPHVW